MAPYFICAGCFMDSFSFENVLFVFAYVGLSYLIYVLTVLTRKLVDAQDDNITKFFDCSFPYKLFALFIRGVLYLMFFLSFVFLPALLIAGIESALVKKAIMTTDADARRETRQHLEMMYVFTPRDTFLHGEPPAPCNPTPLVRQRYTLRNSLRNSLPIIGIIFVVAVGIISYFFFSRG